jgi:riboflavin kinase/FMN adenylyltransferase
MRIFTDLRQAQLDGPTVLTIGNFDGVHLGHQALLTAMKAIAARLEQEQGRPAATAILTFDPHPARVLRPEVPLHLLTTPMERLEIAAGLGVAYGIIQPFTHEIAQLTPEAFMTLLKKHLGLAALVVGPDFALGRNRSGDLPSLRALGAAMGFTVEVIEPIAIQEEIVRSSRIRALLNEGEVARVTALLGRPYRVVGVVEHGDQRGRQVGIPTANLRTPPEKVLPADGVYVTRTLIASFERIDIYPSVTNIGVRPTVNGLHRRVETHILDFPPPDEVDDLYGRTLAVDFLSRLRREMRFPSLDELVKQIHADIAQARAWFASEAQKAAAEQ